mgnify:CR=1 FL=1
MDKSYHRVNITILEEQHRALTEKGLNVSGLIRDLLGDYLADNTINLQVSEQTREIYDTVVSNTGASDQDLEIYFRQALAALLDSKIGAMNALREQLLRKQ